MDNNDRITLLQNEKRAWEEFIKHPKYLQLVSFIEMQMGVRRQESVSAAQSFTVDGNARSVGLMNEIMGMKLSLAMPGILIENINTDLQALLEEEDVPDEE